MARRPDTEETRDSSPELKLVRLRKRADFVRTAQGVRAALPGLVLQCRKSPEPMSPGEVRVGFTATKKLGNAVARNRVKRRLRAAAAEVMPGRARPGHDYVLVGRSGTGRRRFALLIEDLRAALRQVHKGRGRGGAAGNGGKRQER